MENKTAEDFKKQAKIKGIKRWGIHNCSMCGYRCGYIFSNDGENVDYDSGCNCVTYHNIEPRDWDNVASQYNMQEHPEVIKEMDEYWGFK